LLIAIGFGGLEGYIVPNKEFTFLNNLVKVHGSSSPQDDLIVISMVD
jgi:hypothetical protein